MNLNTDKNKLKILVIGDGGRAAELTQCFPGTYEVVCKENVNKTEGFNIVFDLHADEKNYSPGYLPSGCLLVVSAVKNTVADISKTFNNYTHIAGMNLLPSFIGRELKEVSFLQNKPLKDFVAFTESTGWKYKTVKDVVGMVTPRVLAMIINEAAYTLQEGTATREDIDKGMMLGTNYPQGPLQWCDKIGIQHIVDVLEALHVHTGNERYKVCSLLAEKNNRKEKFY